MAFAGHLGVSLNVDLLVTESDGIADSRAEYGDSKNWAAQVSERRNELTLKALFNEELGAVIQVRSARARRGDGAAARARPEPRTATSSASRTTAAWSRSGATPRRMFSAPLRDLHQAWDEVSWRIARQRDNPACADAEHAAAGAPTTPACICT